MTLWLVRLVWASLPVTAGPAAGDALDGWSTPPRTVAEVFLWSAWAATLVAVLAPRPIGLTVARVVAPSFVALAVVVLAGGSADVAAAVVALVATVVAAALALALPSVSLACANGVAYGDERRYPLRTPPVLWLGLLPLASLLVAAGLVTGPLLLADGRTTVGIVALAVGIPARPRDRRSADAARPGPVPARAHRSAPSGATAPPRRRRGPRRAARGARRIGGDETRPPRRVPPDSPRVARLETVARHRAVLRDRRHAGSARDRCVTPHPRRVNASHAYLRDARRPSDTHQRNATYATNAG